MDQTERGELGSKLPTKNFTPSLLVLKAEQSGPPPSTVPLPNQTKVHYDGLSIAIIMSMSMTSLMGLHGFSN